MVDKMVLPCSLFSFGQKWLPPSYINYSRVPAKKVHYGTVPVCLVLLQRDQDMKTVKHQILSLNGER
jgi:hypothetical protein